MEDGQPSRTALATAAARTAHLIVDHDPRIFEDNLVPPLLGDLADEFVEPREYIGASRNTCSWAPALTRLPTAHPWPVSSASSRWTTPTRRPGSVNGWCLTREAVGATVDVIGGFAQGTVFVMEYLLPSEMRDASGEALASFFMPRAAASGEPWLTFYTPTGIGKLLTARGLVIAEDVGRKDQIDPSLWERSDALRPDELGRLVRAVVA